MPLPKIQFALSATTLTDVYTCPADKEAMSVTVYLCNRAATDITFRVSVAVEADANHNKQYIYYGSTLPANDSLKETFVLLSDDVLRVWASTADMSVNIFPDQYIYG